MQALLAVQKVDVDAKDNQGKTPLHWAYARNRRDIARALVSNGANEELQNDEGKTPRDLQK